MEFQCIQNVLRMELGANNKPPGHRNGNSFMHKYKIEDYILVMW